MPSSRSCTANWTRFSQSCASLIALTFSTYLGGSKLDDAYSVAIDSSGNPIISGVTNSEDLVTTKQAFQGRRRGTVDAFVTKVDREGRRVLWSTYYGGSKENSDQYLGGSLADDENGRVWPTGMTNSPDLPTRNPYQAFYAGGDFDGFIAFFSSDGSTLCYGSYAGGNAHDILEGIATGKGHVYPSGLSASANIQQSAGKCNMDSGTDRSAFLISLDIPANLSCR